MHISADEGLSAAPVSPARSKQFVVAVTVPPVSPRRLPGAGEPTTRKRDDMDPNINQEWFNCAAESVALLTAATACNRPGQIDADLPTVAERIKAGENLSALTDELDWLDNQGRL